MEGLKARLAAALAGGPPVFALPPDPVERWRAEAALRPDQPMEVDGIAVVVPTSGSTGEPKGVLLSRSALTSAANALHDRLGGPGAWVVAMPTWHVGGLQVLVRSIVAGMPSIPATWDQLGNVSGSDHRLYVSLVPTQLVRALDAGIDLTRYDAVLVGGAACPPALADQARSAEVRIVLSYGMSETCGGCVYDGRPLDGVDVRLRTEDDRVLVRGPVLFSGYRLAPELTAAAVVDGWYATNDVGRFLDDERLDVLGRADDVIVTGGEKVAPRLVEDRLLQHPAVSDVAVLGLTDGEWGERVSAFVVLSAPADAGELRSWVREGLGRAAAPKNVEFLEALPLLPTGKLDRRALTGAR